MSGGAIFLQVNEEHFCICIYFLNAIIPECYKVLRDVLRSYVVGLTGSKFVVTKGHSIYEVKKMLIMVAFDKYCHIYWAVASDAT